MHLKKKRIPIHNGYSNQKVTKYTFNDKYTGLYRGNYKTILKKVKKKFEWMEK